LAASLPGALGDLEGELVVALNGVSAAAAGIPGHAVTVDLGVNRGVAPGWNAAAGAAGGDVLVFTNDDVVLGPRSLEVMARALREHAKAGVVGPVGSHWDIARGVHVGWADVDGLHAGEVRSCDVVSGWLFATRRDVFDRVGGFDERYAPCSFEEVDFCTAVRNRLGLECLAVGGVEHEHGTAGISLARPWARVRYEGRSESLRAIQRRNRRYFKSKWARAA
jgi:GT2 family glycosyltransferase